MSHRTQPLPASNDGPFETPQVMGRARTGQSKSTLGAVAPSPATHVLLTRFKEGEGLSDNFTAGIVFEGRLQWHHHCLMHVLTLFFRCFRQLCTAFQEAFSTELGRCDECPRAQLDGPTSPHPLATHAVWAPLKAGERRVSYNSGAKNKTHLNCD